MGGRGESVGLDGSLLDASGGVGGNCVDGLNFTSGDVLAGSECGGEFEALFGGVVFEPLIEACEQEGVG